jgi:hypothetical protein
MDGRVTYADNDNFDTVVFTRWQLDSNNLLRTRLDTNSTRTGRFSAILTSGGVFQGSSSSDTAYTPEVLVPYNVAGRFGSTFVQGAIQGTELAANTAVVALPNLSATDLTLGSAYNGTIRTFRMWGQDITDAGLVEATT